MTTQGCIDFIKSHHELLEDCNERHSAFAQMSYIEGLITMASVIGFIDYATDRELKLEVQNIYTKLIASF